MHTMKRFVLGGVMALLALPLVAARAPHSANACSQRAFVAGNADAVARCYAPDAVLWLPGTPVIRGNAAIRAGYANFFAGPR